MTETIYKRIDALLHNAKESRKQMAEAIGVSYRTIETSYARRSGLSIAVIKKIADHFNVTVDYLLSDDENNLSEIKHIRIQQTIFELFELLKQWSANRDNTENNGNVGAKADTIMDKAE
jgi:transcriptional regulator with XRE-family HTH domain